MGKMRTGCDDWPSLPARRMLSRPSRSLLRGSSLRPSVSRTTALMRAGSNAAYIASTDAVAVR
jgi:hypothetical protein